MYQRKNGGLNFRHPKDFNAAFIAKITWIIVKKGDNMCVKAL